MKKIILELNRVWTEDSSKYIIDREQIITGSANEIINYILNNFVVETVEDELNV